MANSKTFTNKRSWLNPISSDDTGAMWYSVEADAFSVDAKLVIRDCSRQIELDFDVYSKASLKERVAKLDKMIAALTEIKDSLPVAYDYHLLAEAEREKKIKAKNAKK